MPTSPKNPQRALCHALKTHNLRAAQRYLSQNPTLLEGDEKWRTQVTLAALGEINAPLVQKEAGWQWLSDRGFVFPVIGEGHTDVLAHALRQEPVAVIEAWCARCGHPAVPVYLLGPAIARHDTVALRWWLEQKLPVEEPPGHFGRMPNVLYAVFLHKLQALDTVALLLAHGAHPLPRVEASAPEAKLETPLLCLTQHYQALEAATSSGQPLATEALTAFRALWTALVAAGDDPAYQSDDGACPLTLLSRTPSAAWWEAQQRQDQSQQQPVPSRPRPRRRA
jgi:hypothetical protein